MSSVLVTVEAACSVTSLALVVEGIVMPLVSTEGIGCMLSDVTGPSKGIDCILSNVISCNEGIGCMLCDVTGSIGDGNCMLSNITGSRKA